MNIYSTIEHLHSAIDCRAHAWCVVTPFSSTARARSPTCYASQNSERKVITFVNVDFEHGLCHWIRGSKYNNKQSIWYWMWWVVNCESNSKTFTIKGSLFIYIMLQCAASLATTVQLTAPLTQIIIYIVKGILVKQ